MLLFLQNLNKILKLSLVRPFKLIDLENRTGPELSAYGKIVDLLVKENILCRIGGFYRLHSTLVKTFLQEYLEN